MIESRYANRSATLPSPSPSLTAVVQVRISHGCDGPSATATCLVRGTLHPSLLRYSRRWALPSRASKKNLPGLVHSC
ncbi:hypothetical protein M407DRAFT_185518 [Tulasnella calospora MUT 4182]|uniref:Uncharacterized protein n=1 Tax=Tulasnella calospora MUT 4182 TaxID=1051891 RepID=A0A0C3QBT2_9AGAM|nr:hypothetical protein M407DRAFT_185518 [Tulasnella calospora MUT 4182]